MAHPVELAHQSTVSYFENLMTKLIIEAEQSGVVLEVRLEPKQPLAMGNYRAVAHAYSMVRYEDD